MKVAKTNSIFILLIFIMHVLYDIINTSKLLDLRHCLIPNSQGTLCDKCIQPYKSISGHCHNEPYEIISHCQITFMNLETYNCFTCDQEYFFTDKKKCEKCEEVEYCSTDCNDINCESCLASDLDYCLQCEDATLSINNEGKCVCPLGTHEVFYTKSDSNELYKYCYSCKLKYGWSCSTCNSQECTSCLDPYCQYYEESKTCLCSLDIYKSCVYFNTMHQIYYDYECFCFNERGECVVTCKQAYNSDALACDENFAYYTNYVLDTTIYYNNFICKLNEMYDSVTNTCLPCEENCKVCNSKGDCLLNNQNIRQHCPKMTGFALNTQDNLCFDCDYFNTGSSGLVCNESKVVSGSLCNFILNPNCDVCDPVRGCTSCSDNYFLFKGSLSIINEVNTNYIGICLSCKFIDLHCASCTNIICLECETDYVLIVLNVCVPTNEYFNRFDNLPVTIDHHCNDPNCLVCSSNYHCVLCKVDYELSLIDFTCRLSYCYIDNCSYCVSNTTCFKCSLIYVIVFNEDNISNRCVLSFDFIISIGVISFFIIFVLVFFNIGICGFRKMYLFHEFFPICITYISRFFCPKKKKVNYKKIISSSDIQMKIIEEEKSISLPIKVVNIDDYNKSSLEKNKEGNVSNKKNNGNYKDESRDNLDKYYTNPNENNNSRNKKEDNIRNSYSHLSAEDKIDSKEVLVDGDLKKNNKSKKCENVNEDNKIDSNVIKFNDYEVSITEEN